MPGFTSGGLGVRGCDADDMQQVYVTNTIGPLMLTQSLLPLLKRVASCASSKPLVWERVAIINMSSRLGSISANNSGDLYPYHCSKAAVNAMTKPLSVDLLKDGIITIAVDPGWVSTDMGGSNAPSTVDETVQGMVKLLSSLNQDSNGGFLKCDGTMTQW